jgi:hypothetical protein
LDLRLRPDTPGKPPIDMETIRYCMCDTARSLPWPAIRADVAPAYPVVLWTAFEVPNTLPEAPRARTS